MSVINAAAVPTSSGRLLGTTDGSTRQYLGIPYAEPPESRLRFARPVPLDTPGVERDAASWGAAPLQSRSRLENTMGPMPAVRQSEDCLQLNVWTPAARGRDPWPVLVWIHGGGYLFGSAASPWYDGSTLARENGIVVVTIGFRVGLLGYASLPRQGISNLGLRDQILALKWVRENIAAFGGDPENITLAGQSSGAHSAVAIASIQQSSGCPAFHRLMLLSAPLGMGVPTAEAAALTQRSGRKLAASLESSAGPQIIACQDKIVAERHRWGAVGWPIQLCVDSDVLAADPFADLGWLAATPMPLLLMWTAQEGATHFAADTDAHGLTASHIAQRLRMEAEEPSTSRAAAFLREAARRADTAPISVLADMIGRTMYTDRIMTVLDRRRILGTPTEAVVFAIESEAFGGRLKAGHATDLPYVFGAQENWKAAPSLAGMGATEFTTLSRALRTRLTDFMRIPAEHMATATVATHALTRNGWRGPVPSPAV